MPPASPSPAPPRRQVDIRPRRRTRVCAARPHRAPCRRGRCPVSRRHARPSPRSISRRRIRHRRRVCRPVRRSFGRSSRAEADSSGAAARTSRCRDPTSDGRARRTSRARLRRHCRAHPISPNAAMPYVQSLQPLLPKSGRRGKRRLVGGLQRAVSNYPSAGDPDIGDRFPTHRVDEM